MSFEPGTARQSTTRFTRQAANTPPASIEKPRVTEGVAPIFGPLVAEAAQDWSSLRPDAQQISKVEKLDPRSFPSIQEDAHHKTLRIMNALRTLGPSIRSATDHTNDEVAQAQYFLRLTQAAHRCSEQVFPLLAPEKQPKNVWMMNVLDRLFVEALSPIDESNWPASGAQMAESVMSYAEATRFEHPEWVQMGENSHVKMAIIQAMNPLLLAQMRFDFYRDRNSDLQALRELLIRNTLEALMELPPITKSEDRVTLFQVLITEAGQGLAQCWDHEAKIVQDAWAQHSNAENERWREANPDGFSIEGILQQFEQYFRRLKMLAFQAGAKKK